MNPIKIILAEEKELRRKSLVALLKTVPEFEIVADAGNGRELMELLKQKKTNVVLLDYELKTIDPRSLLDIIRKRFPDVRVLIMNIDAEYPIISDFMKHGANGCLSRNCEEHTFYTAVKEVMAEGYFMDKANTRVLLEATSRDLAEQQGVLFNDRETEILRELCEGKSNKEIADTLHLSTSTIDFHKGKIYSKTKCSNVVQLFRFALKKGIVVV